MTTLHQIAEQYVWGSPGFIREIDTHLGLDCSREEIERIASRSSTAEEFMAIWENEDWWCDTHLVMDAKAALDQWDPDAADEDEIAAVFEAIFERVPDRDDDPVSDIYAAAPVLDAIEAERVIKVLCRR